MGTVIAVGMDKAKEFSLRVSQIKEDIKQGDILSKRMGENLDAIREGKLYTVRGYKTFSEFIEKEFKESKRHIFRLIDYKDVQEEYKDISGVENLTERQTRQIRTLPIENQRKLLERTIKEQLSSRDLEGIVKKKKAPPKPAGQGGVKEESEDDYSFIAIFNMRAMKELTGDVIYGEMDEKIKIELEKKPFSTHLSDLIDERTGDPTSYNGIEVGFRVKFISTVKK